MPFLYCIGEAIFLFEEYDRLISGLFAGRKEHEKRICRDWFRKIWWKCLP